jgi:hypothetical protein
MRWDMTRPTDDAHTFFDDALKHIEIAGHRLATLQSGAGDPSDKGVADLELAPGFWDLTKGLQSLTTGLRATHILLEEVKNQRR